MLLKRKYIYVLQVLMTIAWLLPTHDVAAQQKPMFSQYMFNMININPAYAGNRRTLNFSGLYRNQWVGIEGAPKTTSFSMDYRGAESNVGLGLQIYDDQIGVERTTGFNTFYSYHVPFENATLSLGISAGMLNYTATYTRTTTVDPNDPAFMQNIRGWLPSFGAGAILSMPKWYVAFSVPDMLKTKISNQGRADVSSTSPFKHYFLTGGLILDLNEDFSFKPSVLLKAVSGSPMQADLNANFWYRNVFSIGASYRTGDAIVGLAELQASPKIRIGYGYDFTISKLANYSRGTHELMLRFELRLKKNDVIADENLSPRYY